MKRKKHDFHEFCKSWFNVRCHYSDLGSNKKIPVFVFDPGIDEDYIEYKESTPELKSRKIRLYLTHEEQKKLSTERDFAKMGRNFVMRDRKKKDIQSMMILARDFTWRNGVYSWLKRIVTSEEIPEVNYAVVIAKNYCNENYIHVPIPLEERENKMSSCGRIVNIDPGVRTTFTCYDLRGRAIEWGNGDFNRIVRLSKKCNKLRSEIG
ncbi:37946_t:CDS:2 [Gigaspora margarita]|uniref:37946_t:CDS:1 n=1 Tax=Gigaspora margarita TaxID=4874 RepID=A0ABN7W6Z1_GIGMA|nr:37946_t:CDS:2 [Gigaspora margarita]